MRRCTCLIHLVIFFVIVRKNINSNSVTQSESENKLNFKIAAILPIFERFGDARKHMYKCSKEMRKHEIQHVEALYYALDLIESDEEFSKKFTLKIEVLEGCGDEVMDLKYISELLVEAFRKYEIIPKILVESPDYKYDMKTAHSIGVIYSNDEFGLNFDGALLSFPYFPHFSLSGPSKKSFSMNERTSNETLANTNDFFQVSSGSIFIVDVIFEILKHYGWKYVAVITPGGFISFEILTLRFFHAFSGCMHKPVIAQTSGVENHIRRMAENDEVCMSHIMTESELLGVLTNNENLRSVIPLYNSTDVIICYCDVFTIDLLRNYLLATIKDKKFVIIAGNADNPRYFYGMPSRSEFIDMFFVTPAYQDIEEFRNYFTSLSSKNDTRHSYLRTFRKRYFRDYSFNSYADIYLNNSKATNIIKSVHVLAHGIKNVLNKHPDLKLENLSDLKSFRSTLQSNLPKVNFTLFGDEICFTGKGFPQREKFDIYKIQSMEGFMSCDSIKVAEYLKTGDTFDETHRNDILRIRGNLNILIDDVFQYTSYSLKKTCGNSCPLGFVKEPQKIPCCWECVPCSPFEIVNHDATSCIKCKNGLMPDQNRTECIPMAVYLPSVRTEAQNIVSMGFSSLPIILTIVVFSIFVKHRNTPAVKSTTKELCYVMFGGIILANSTLFISALTLNFHTPNDKILPAIGLTMMYAALLVKTNRIARLLVTSKHRFANINPKFMSINSQMIITGILIGIEIMLCLVWVYTQNPDLKTEERDFILKTYYLDGQFFIKIITFVALLILLCTYYAIKTRNLPENFNETKYIGFSMYATLLTAVAFGFVHFASDKKILATNLCVSINSLTILVFLFSPKLYIILWRPERNTKVNFSLITGDIRSHMGKQSRRRDHPNGSADNYLLEATEQSVSNADSARQQTHDLICKIETELNIVLDKISHFDEKTMEKTVEKDDLEDEKVQVEISRKAYNEMIEKVKICRTELNHLQKMLIKKTK